MMNLNRLLFFENIRNDEIVRAASKIINIYHKKDRDPREAEDLYYSLQRSLLAAVTTADTEGTYWQNYICRLVAESENTFSLAAEKGMTSDNLLTLASGDLAEIAALFSTDWDAVAAMIGDKRPSVCMLIPPVIEDGRAARIKGILSLTDPDAAVRELAAYYKENFCGILGKYRAFMWDGKLVGVKNHDNITFSDLIGYDTQQQQLIHNAEVLLAGRRANNVLLYGDKGTGKSSSVKALLNKFAGDGMRMINLPKDRIFDITEIMKLVSDRGCKFIIFIDDLSFEETEIEYKHFKSVLEGSVEVQPKNVIICVTSNRRNLVKETWRDRNDTDGEIHVMDGVHERQSLADRFGLTITFSAPDKDLYNEIVMAMAKREGVDIDEGKLIVEANKWDMRQTSRSGRSAKQFIMNIAGLKE